MSIPEEYIEEFRSELGREQDKVWFIREYLLTPEQKQWLFDHDLSIEDLLNGRHSVDLGEYISAIFDDWNGVLGTSHFRYW